MGHVCTFSVDLGGCVADVAQDVPHLHRMGVIPFVVIPVFCWGERGHVQDRDLEAVACPPGSERNAFVRFKAQTVKTRAFNMSTLFKHHVVE